MSPAGDKPERRLSLGESGAEPSHDSGFTLIELLVTLALAGLLLALVPPLLGKGTDAARLKHDRRIIAAELRQARSQAIASGKSVPVHPRVSDGVTLTIDNDIVFFPDGSASGGAIDLANKSGHARLSVDWLTGAVAP
jgi:general secretion pathway protein H